jgi:hypothetical protein
MYLFSGARDLTKGFMHAKHPPYLLSYMNSLPIIKKKIDDSWKYFGCILLNKI